MTYWAKVWAGVKLDIASEMVWYDTFITKGSVEGLGVSIIIGKDALKEVRKYDDDLDKKADQLLLGMEEYVDVVCDLWYHPLAGGAFWGPPEIPIRNVAIRYILFEEEDSMIGTEVSVDRNHVVDKEVLWRLDAKLN